MWPWGVHKATPKRGQSRGFALWAPCLVFGSSGRSQRGGKAPVDVKPSINKTPAAGGAPRELSPPLGDSMTHQAMGTA